MHQTFEKSSLAMTCKFDDMIELPKSQPKRKYKEDLDCEMVMVKIPKCMSWLDAYDEPIGDLDMMEDKVDNPSPQSTPQVLTSFKEYPSPVTYPGETEETLGTPYGVPSFDEPEPQPHPLPNYPSLDVSLGDEKGLEPPIKPHSPDSFRMKVVEPLTIRTPPSPPVASLHLKDVYCYYHPCIDDPEKHYGFKPDGVTTPAHVIFDEEKLESSLDFHVDDSWMTI
ncbi:hypothetical protein Tco_0465977 [Tanacetum coccineum]